MTAGIDLMSWDPTWEQVFRSRTWGKYPPEELIRFVAANYYNANERSRVRILDLGCGTGACLWYLAKEGFDAYGVDGSSAAARRAQTRMKEEKLSASVAVSDLVALPCPTGYFDGAIDVASIQHNTWGNVALIMKEVCRVLKPHGKFFSMMIKSGSWGWGSGTKLESGTYASIPEGPFAGKGRVHFFTRNDIVRVLRESRLRLASMELSTRTLDNQRKAITHFVVTAVKAHTRQGG